jgi:hypothetical protein
VSTIEDRLTGTITLSQAKALVRTPAHRPGLPRRESSEADPPPVLTDGSIPSAAYPMPYEVLGVLWDETAREGIRPSYGHVLALPPLPR